MSTLMLIKSMHLCWYTRTGDMLYMLCRGKRRIIFKGMISNWMQTVMLPLPWEEHFFSPPPPPPPQKK